MPDPSRIITEATRLIREEPGWSTAALADALDVSEDVLYVLLYRLGRSQGLTLSVIHDWVPVEDPRLAGVRDAAGPPCPEPTPAQFEAFDE